MAQTPDVISSVTQSRRAVSSAQCLTLIRNQERVVIGERKVLGAVPTLAVLRHIVNDHPQCCKGFFPPFQLLAHHKRL
jgi:hypothetical protein